MGWGGEEVVGIEREATVEGLPKARRWKEVKLVPARNG